MAIVEVREIVKSQHGLNTPYGTKDHSVCKVFVPENGQMYDIGVWRNAEVGDTIVGTFKELDQRNGFYKFAIEKYISANPAAAPTSSPAPAPGAVLTPPPGMAPLPPGAPAPAPAAAAPAPAPAPVPSALPKPNPGASTEQQYDRKKDPETQSFINHNAVFASVMSALAGRKDLDDVEIEKLLTTGITFVEQGKLVSWSTKDQHSEMVKTYGSEAAAEAFAELTKGKRALRLLTYEEAQELIDSQAEPPTETQGSEATPTK